MKLFIICLLFAPIVYLALRQKKWYLYLLFAFIGVLPEQFSVKLHESIPLLTASRILILILTGFWLYDKWNTKKFRFPKSLLAFFAINLIISLVNLRYGTDDINRIFLLIFERVLLVIMVTDMIHDKEEFHRCIDFSIMGCAALAVIGIVQTVFDYDLSSVLHLTETITSIKLSARMGLVRAFGTYNAISYGCYCTFMAFLILYRLYATKSVWHGAAFALNFVALVCTFTRSAWLCFAMVAFIALIFFRMKLIRRLLPSIAMTLALVAILCCFQPKLFNAFVETGKSSINTVLGILPDRVVSIFLPESPETPDTPEATDPTEPSTPRPGFELDEDFGANADDPTYSRNAQWTAIEYMAKEGTLLFGYGYNALPRGKIHFFFDRWAAQWQPTTFLDVGLVALIAESGLIGAISYLGLLIYMAIYSVLQLRKKKGFSFYALTLLMLPLYLLLNFLASFLSQSVVWLFFGLFYASMELDKKASPDSDSLPSSTSDTGKNSDAPTVSIYVATFNHENYITRALDSILMQKVDFPYEVFVGEDCSTDNTRQVLKQWENSHQDDRFHILYREENMHCMPVNNATDLKRRCTGKYIICLEGDDYWTDPTKLQQQVDFLESHPDYYAIAHNCVVVDENSQPNGETYPECKDEQYTLRHFASELLPGQYATMLARNYMTDPDMDKSLLSITGGGAGDQRVYFSLLCHGRIRCIQKVMSAYRHVTGHGTSFSATNKYNYDRLEKYYREFLEYAYGFSDPEPAKYAEFIYLRTIRHAQRNGHIDAVRAKADKKNIRHRFRAACLLLKRDINRRIFHKTLHV